MILTGDVNLMNVDDPAVPFARVQDEFRAADIVFSNLECCLYDPPRGHAVENEGFFASPTIAGETLRAAGIAAVGIANNVNYGEAAITASIARLDAARHSAHRRRSERRGCTRARSSWSATASATASCSAARCTGRPTMRPAPTPPASR